MAALPLHLKSLDDPEPRVVEQKVFDILNEYLQPSSPTAPTVAARGIDALIPAKRPDLGDDKERKSPESFMWEIWGIFIAIAKQIPHAHPSQDRLFEVITALSELPPTTVEIWDSDMRIWTDLPLLGPSMREAWISPSCNSSSPDRKREAEWINQNSFAARLLNHNAVTWSNFAIWELRSALEGESSEAQITCSVTAAAEWITHSGDVLFEELDKDTENNVKAPGVLYKGKGSLSRDRWQFWKQRFCDIGELESGTVKTVAQEAKRKMEIVEKKGV